MAYQTGILIFLMLLSVCVTVTFVAALWQRDFTILAAAVVPMLICAVYIFRPYGLLRRLRMLFVEGVPLAPHGFRRNATVGYWLGIPLIYSGHIITLGAFVIGWQLIQQPVSGAPIGIAFAYSIMAYSLGIGMVESSYTYWKRRQKGVMPGDAGTSPLRGFLWAVAIASVVASVATVNALTARSEAIAARARVTVSPSGPVPIVPSAHVQLIDFLELTEPGWVGFRSHHGDSSSVFSRESAVMHATLTGSDTLTLRVESPDNRDSPDTRESMVFQLTQDGSFIDGLAIVRRVENQGVLRIVAFGEGEDEGRSARLRLTFTIAEAEFQLRRDLEISPNQFRPRAEYDFSRSSDD